MALMAVAFPIAPGKTDDWRRFIGELNGPRHADYEASRRRLGVHERASRITLVDRRVGLDHSLIVNAFRRREIPVHGADDAHGDRGMRVVDEKSERVADGDGPFADKQGIGIAELDA